MPKKNKQKNKSNQQASKQEQKDDRNLNSEENNKNEQDASVTNQQETETIYIPPPKNFTDEQLQTTDNLTRVEARFDLISKRFQGFESQLIQDRDRKLREQQIKIDQIKAAVSEIKQFLKELSGSRSEHINRVSKRLTSLIDDWAANQPPPIHEKLDQLDEKIDQIYDRLDVLQNKIKQDYDDFMVLINTKVEAIVKILNEFRQTYNDFQQNRTSKDEQIIEQLKQLDRKYFTLFKTEREEREKGLDDVAAQIPSIVDARQKGNEEMELEIEKSILAITNKIEKESQLTKETNAELLQQIEHYTDRLKNCVKML